MGILLLNKYTSKWTKTPIKHTYQRYKNREFCTDAKSYTNKIFNLKINGYFPNSSEKSGFRMRLS